MTDYIREDKETDRLEDAVKHCAACGAVCNDTHLCQMGSGGTSDLPPITQAEIDATIKRVSKDIEAMTRDVEQAGNALD